MLAWVHIPHFSPLFRIHVLYWTWTEEQKQVRPGNETKLSLHMAHTSLCILSPVTTMMQATSPLGLLPTQTNHVAIFLKSHSRCLTVLLTLYITSCWIRGEGGGGVYGWNLKIIEYLSICTRRSIICKSLLVLTLSKCHNTLCWK